MNGRALPGADPDRKADGEAGRGNACPRSSADIAHDLRTPLNAIRTWTHLLESRLGDAADPSVRRALDGIHTAIDQQVKLIDDLGAGGS